MKFNTSKNKLEKIEKTQGDIDNSLSNKKNELKNLKSFPAVLKTITPLFDSDFQVFSTTEIFGDLISVPIGMPIVADNISFSGSLNISKEMIPYVRHSVIIKKPILNDIRGVYTANISTYDADPDTQTGIFQENVNIFRETPSGLILVGNTGSGSGTSSSGDNLVTLTSNPLFIIDGQRNIYSEDNTSSLNWEKVTDNFYNFSIDASAMIIVSTEELENTGVSNQEGDRVYVATLSEGDIIFYIVTDNRVAVSYPAYQPIESDIEAKLILSIPSRNLWENYTHYKS
jgi:hypothetical protein